MIAFKPFTKVTLDDAKYVVRNVFGENACNKLETMILNPALEEVPGSDCGEVLYIDGKPAGFNAAILRKMYYKDVSFWGISGSTLCLLPEARKEMACVDLLKKIVAPRFGSKMFFGNSANKRGLKVTRAFGIDGETPITTAQKRIVVIRPIQFAIYLFNSKLLKKAGCRARTVNKAKLAIRDIYISGYGIRRIEDFSDYEFNGFWSEYVEGNQGYVCSRSAKELKWLWRERVLTDKALIVGAYRDESLRGFAIFYTDEIGMAWHVGDLIAIGNNTEILSVVLGGGLKLLKKATRAVHCDISGFPDSAQDVIKANFPILRNLSNNQFTWKFHSPDAPSFEDLNSSKSWFFGPYDGDLCL